MVYIALTLSAAFGFLYGVVRFFRDESPLYARASNRAAWAQDLTSEIYPIRNIAFGYGDANPSLATEEQLAVVYGSTLTGMSRFDVEAFRDPSWEYVLGVTGSAENYRLDGSTGFPMSLNHGILPQTGNRGRHSGDNRVMMYVDRASYDQFGRGTAS